MSEQTIDVAAQAESKTVDVVRLYMKQLRSDGVPVDFVVLFGSHVSGELHQWSDIDAMVVSPRFDASHSLTDRARLWRTASHVDSRIEPHACGSRQWREDKTIPLIEIVRREGQIVTIE